MRYEFRPGVKLLLRDHSNEQLKIVYLSRAWFVPRIGLRPPYYANPRYKTQFPLI